MFAINELKEMKPISSDGHITEPPDIFKSRINKPESFPPELQA